MASLTHFESSLMTERVKAGMVRAKAQGKRCSRPPISENTQAEIARLDRKKVSINQISQRFGVAYETAWNYLRAVAPEEGKPSRDSSSFP